MNNKIVYLKYSHLILAPIFIVLFLGTANEEVTFLVGDVFGAYLICQGILFIFLFGINLFKRNLKSSSFIATAIFLLFFSFDAFFEIVDSIEWTSCFLLVLAGLIFYGVKFLDINKFNKILSIALLLLVAQGGIIVIQKNIFVFHDTNFVDKTPVVLQKTNVNRPIYHFYLDAFARQDVLRSMYHVKGYDFAHELKKLGFYVLENSSTNYTQTIFSMSSTLNMNYLDAYENQYNIQTRKDVVRSIYTSKVFNKLRSFGYKIIAFDSGAQIDLRPGVDEYIDPARTGVFLSNNSKYEFLNLLFRKTIFSQFDSLFGVVSLDFQGHQRALVLNTLKSVADFPKRKEKNYYFIHLMCPHPPFVFNEEGLPTDDPMEIGYIGDGTHYTKSDKKRIENYKRFYARQAVFVARSIITLLKEILAQSEIKPIIILQSDHGPGSELDQESYEKTNRCERKAIFDAFYFPDVQLDLHGSFTPVNTYRLLFDLYFDGNYKMLENKSYYLSWSNPFSPRLIQDQCVFKEEK